MLTNPIFFSKGVVISDYNFKTLQKIIKSLQGEMWN